MSEPVSALKLTREGLEQSLVGNPDPRGFLEAVLLDEYDRQIIAHFRTLRLVLGELKE